jgi:PAS domain S-box-containing protein
MTVIDKDVLGRVKELVRYQIIESRRDRRFEKSTKLAASIFDIPIAFISFVDERRHWIKSSVGWNLTQSSKEDSFCLHTIQSTDVFIVEDASRDTRFKENRFVKAPDGVRFYAGAPLVTPRGVRLGALAVMDRKPRSLTGKQIDILRTLSESVMHEIENYLNEFRREDAVSAVEIITLTSPDAIVFLDNNFRIKRINPAAEEVFRVSKKDLIGQHHDIMVPRRFRPIYDEMLRQAADGLVVQGKPQEKYNLNGVRFNGTEFPMWIRIAKVNLHHQVNLVLTIRDLTAQVTMENELRIATEASARISETRERFLLSLSHEMRTPLNNVIGFSEIMAGDLLGSIGPGRYQSYAKAVAASGWQLARMINAAVEASDLAGKVFVCTPQPLDLTASVHLVVERLSGSLGAKSIRLIVQDGNVGEQPISTDPLLLDQILEQLLSNAINFSHEYGLVKIETEIVPLRGEVEIRVTDHGLGIALTDLGRVGEPFFRGTTAVQNDVPGAGMGLAIAHRMAASMGGRIEIFGEPGLGTTAILTLSHS